MDIKKEESLVNATQHIMNHIQKTLLELNLNNDPNSAEFLLNFITHISINLIIPIFKGVQDKKICKDMLNEIINHIKEGVSFVCQLDEGDHEKH